MTPGDLGFEQRVRFAASRQSNSTPEVRTCLPRQRTGATLRFWAASAWHSGRYHADLPDSVTRSVSACGSQQLRGPAPVSSSTASEVRAVRAESNAAIAARDLDAVTASMPSDIVPTGGNGGILTGRDSVRAAFAKDFADSTF